MVRQSTGQNASGQADGGDSWKTAFQKTVKAHVVRTGELAFPLGLTAYLTTS